MLIMGPPHEVMEVVHAMSEESRKQTDLLKASTRFSRACKTALELIRNESRQREIGAASQRVRKTGSPILPATLTPASKVYPRRNMRVIVILAMLLCAVCSTTAMACGLAMATGGRGSRP
ncbi:MAG: hypothetical protein BGN91_02905 [Nitrobacter sp. 62-13]|uniref:hypothetical protein n=1 Tax=Nitrobacter sp. 62-13 TaxID=1895797 RepID=UPI0009692884|nr:hypothetical protein [Nitrobacter sp. 62-13]OJU30450.1 MAG: hypothetical protein BGN91_02905 [Nitrobacter sp. 62-13]